MKILTLKFKNLNSLQDEIEIDFTKFGNSIFAITGETGAGKTTILDAICVSLYGETPRLKNIKELVSKNKSNAYSEVTFEVKGVIYRSFWSLRRARNNIEGKFQGTVRELYQDDKLITARARDISKKIEEITNLNFKNFTKSLLLAQGSFDAFLKANKNDKSEILQKITGTEIYRNISAKIFEKTKKKEMKIADIEKEIKLLDLLDDEKRLEYKILKDEIDKEIENIDKQIIISDKKEKIKLDLKNKNKNKDELEEFIIKNRLEINVLEQKYNLEEKKYKDFIDFYKIEKEKISSAKKIEFEIINFKKENEKLENEFRNNQKEIEKSQKEIENRKKESKILEDKKNAGIIFLKSNIYIEDLIKNESLIKDIINNIRYQKKIKNEKLQNIKNYKKTDETIIDIIHNIEIIEAEKNRLTNSIKLLGDDEDLYLNLEEIIKILDNIKEYKRIKKEIKKNQNKKIVQIEKQKTIELELKNNQKALNLINDHLKDLLIQKDREIKIKKYENDRKSLKKGEACSLCGSKEHPYITHYPNIDSEITEKIKRKEKEKKEYKKRVKDLFKNQIIIKESLNFLDIEFTNLNNKMNKLIGLEVDRKDENLLIKSKDELIIKIKKLKDLKKEREKKLNLLIEKNIQKDILEIDYEIKNLEEKLKIQIKDMNLNIYDLDSIIKKIANLIKKYQNHIENREKLTENLNRLTNSILILTNETSRLFKERKKINNNIDLVDIEINNLNITREDITQEKNLDNYQLRLEKKEKNLRDEIQNIQNTLLQTKSILDIKVTDLDKIKIEIEESIKKSSNLDLKLKELDINTTLDDLKREKDNFNQELGKISEKLKQDKDKQRKNLKLLSQKEKLEEDYKVWSTLNDLIGSAKGDKFEKYALNQTLGYLCNLANRHLVKLNRRYSLIPSNNIKELLTLNIIDKYQANIIRPVSTLSGGESFLVSLALSLGLSDLVSQKIEIRSIFLDEGFGTLDDENLDMVISTLEGLQLEGKTIGVISHVENLKSRITNQIVVKKRGDGSSSVDIYYD